MADWIKFFYVDCRIVSPVSGLISGILKVEEGKIVVDGKTLYNHPEIASDLRKTIELLEKSSIDTARYIEISATLADVEKCTAEIKIQKTHRKKEHSIDILMKGEIKTELYHVFGNYLVEKLGLKKESLNQ